MFVLMFFLGATIGSFLGVVIYRMPLGLNVVQGRSHCDTCNRDLAPIDLIPIVSYLMFWGKCRTCKSSIPSRFIWVEIITGFAFMLSYVSFGDSIQTLLAMIVASTLIVLSFIDLDTMIINDRFHLILIGIGLTMIAMNTNTLMTAVVGSVVISVPYFLLALHTGGIGLGDVKLMASSGLILGTGGIITAFILSSLLGGIYAIYLIASKRAKVGSQVPFGPFLSIGIFVSLLYGQSLMGLYLGLFT